MLCGPVSSNTKLPVAMPRHYLGLDARNMYSGLQTPHMDTKQIYFAPEIGLKRNSKPDYGRPMAIVVTRSGNSKVAHIRMLQKRFSALGGFQVISESDAYDRPDAIGLRLKDAASNKETCSAVAQPVTIGTANKKARSEVSLFLTRQPGLFETNTKDDGRTAVERPSEEITDINTNTELKTSAYRVEKPRRASVQHIGSYEQINTEAKSSRRKMSVPARSGTLLVNHSRSASLDSLGNKSRDNHIQNTHWNAQDDTDLQWERLVARARSFQTLASSPMPERAHPRFDRKDNNARKAEPSSRIQPVTEDDDVKSDDGSEISDAGSETSHASTSSSCASASTGTGETTKSATRSAKSDLLFNDKQIIDHRETTENETDEKDIVTTSIDNENTVKDNKSVENNSLPNHRRFSLATSRPQTQSVERISGYSTHGALEYAKKLLGKIQEEGKSKSKKDRLLDMSRALKLVLEELNRIESPDRELVSLFISLRAKIVNLKAELKNEESDCSEDEKQNEISRCGMSKTLPSSASGHDNPESPHARRFSWC